MRRAPGDGRDGGAGEHRPAGAACVEIREEIMAAVLDGGAVSVVAAVHIERCGPCRAWEAEFRKMHDICRESASVRDPSHLTLSAIERSAGGSARPGERGRARGRRSERSADRGVFFVVLAAVVLFNLMLIRVLDGGARGLYPAVSFIVMLVSAVWAYLDAARRGMRVAFWTALVPLTFPIGLIAYLVCRERGSLRCPTCGNSVPADRRFCPDCGGALGEVCCSCGRPVRKEFRVCPFCGARLETCFPREEDAAGPCGWSSGQIAFLVAANAALFAGFLAALLWGQARTSFGVAGLYLLGYLPVFNWVSIDSRRRAMATVAWGVLVLVTLYIGLIIYGACRRDERIACPVCGSYPPVSFNFCPCCGSALSAVCHRCGAAVGRGQRFCSSCGGALVSEDASRQSRG
jgi:hypothetical protein